MLRVVPLLLLVTFHANAIHTGRIVGGSNALPGELPHQASLRFWGTNFHFAGGTLISNRWLVTAANYLVGRAEDSINIVLGTTSLTANAVNHRSERIVVHAAYDRDSNINNIAVIRSATLIQTTIFVQPIALSLNVIAPGASGRVSGWGATQNDKGPDSNFLQARDVLVIECANNDYFNALPQHLCGEATLCTSDIGGPLILGNQLIGIAAWHHPLICGAAGDHDFYMRISFFRNWILGNID